MLETVIAWTVYVLAVAFVVIRFFVLPILESLQGMPEVDPEEEDVSAVGFDLSPQDDYEELE